MPNQVMNALVARGFPNAAPSFDVFEAQGKSNALAKQRLDLEAYPEERNWLRKARGMKVEEFEMDKERFGLEKKKQGLAEARFNAEQFDRMQRIARQGFVNAKETYQFLLDQAPLINLGNYGESRKWMIERGLPETMLPPVESFKGDSAAFEAWKQKGLQSSKDALRAELDKERLDLDKKRLELEEKKFEKGDKEKKTSFGQLIDEYNALPAGKDKDLYAARILKEAQSSGETIEVTKDGIKITRGAGGVEGLTKKTQGDIEEKSMTASTMLQGFEEIESIANTDLLTWKSKAKNWGLETWWKLTGKDLSNEDKKFIGDFKTMSSRVMKQIFDYVFSISGKAVTDKERDMIVSILPNMSDSGPAFEAGLKSIKEQLKYALIRYNYIRKKGLKMEDIGLGTIKDMINRRGAEIEKEESGKGFSGDELKENIRTRLRMEFPVKEAESQ